MIAIMRSKVPHEANILRVIPDGDRVHLEVTGRHDATQVCTTVTVERASLVAALHQAGVLP